ncbi:MAG TPA: molybdenum cofactor biosynthesis protein MoaE [Thermoplasmata archaeon]|nr:molybdenum cofactor biosynthesis protein MoaE [Thermoplasmata archaeon]
MPVRLTRRPLSPARVWAELADPSSGGVVVFVGRVRPDRVGGRRVRALDYEADPRMALEALRRLERGVRRRFGARIVVAEHRLGRVPVGEASVIVGAAAPHRAQAFSAARYLIDRLKREVPIWKMERGRPARRRRRRPRPSTARSSG